MIRQEGLSPVCIPRVLPQHVLASGVNERSETLRLADTAVAPQDGDHSAEGLLADIIHAFGRKVPGAQHDAENLSKIGHKMLLRRRFTIPEAIHIRLVESKKFQIVLG